MNSLALQRALKSASAPAQQSQCGFDLASGDSKAYRVRVFRDVRDVETIASRQVVSRG